MNEIKSRNYPVIDILKFFFALCVVAVHVWFLYDTKIGYYLYTMLYRLPVPFFFFASGYFLANKVAGEDRDTKFGIFLKKTLVRYVLLSMICILVNLVKGNCFSLTMILQNIYQVVVGDCWGIAWFLGALFYSCLILYFLKEKKQVKTALIISLILNVIALFCTTYAFLIKNNDFNQIYNFFIDKFGNSSNWIFEGFLLVGLGYYIRMYSTKAKELSIKYFYLLLIIGLGTLFLEVSYIKPHLAEITDYGYYFSHLIIIPSIFMIGIKTRLNNLIKRSTSIFRNLSIYFFYFHPTVLELLLLYRNYTGNEFLLSNVGFYVSICIITLIISVVLIKYAKTSKLNNEKKLLAFGIYLISFIMLIFSLLTLLNKVVWADEACSLSMLKHSLIDIIKLNINDVHPPLYYLTLKVFYNISSFLHIGINTIVLSKFFSFIPLILLFVFGITKIRKKYGEITSSLFCLLIAGMPHLMEYFVELRMYSWALCFTTISFIYLTDILDKHDADNKSWIKFMIFSLLAAYSHLYSCLAIGLLYAYLLISYIIKKNNEQLKMWFKYSVLTILLYLPWIIVIVKQFTSVSGDFWIPPITLNDVKSYFYFVLQSSTPDALLSKISLIFTAGSLLYLLIVYMLNKENDRVKKGYIFYGLLIPFIVMGIGVLVSVIINPLFISRYLVPTLGCIWFATALLIGNYYKNHKAGIAIIFIFGIFACSNVNSLIRYEISVEKNKIIFDQYLEDINKNDIIISDYQHTQLVLSYFKKDNNIYCYECSNSKMIKDLFINIKDKVNINNISKFKDDNKRIYFFSSNFDNNYDELFTNTNITIKNVSPILYEDWYQIVIYEL